MAVYMGFSEIYLIGVDCSYANEIDRNEKRISNETKNYFDESYQNEIRYSNTYKMLQAYNKANEYASKHNIKIFNATRGGKLDIFERVDFDKIKFE